MKSGLRSKGKREREEREDQKQRKQMKLHTLKIDKCFWENLDSGKKKCEIRFNDRDYQVGDALFFPYMTENGCQVATGSQSHFEITHIHTGIGVKDGFVLLSLEKK
jgi:hypothetical protein